MITKDTDSDYNIDIKEIFFILRRNQNIILAFLFFFVILMLVFLFLKEPLYTAKSVMQINVKTEKVVDFESVVSGISSDDAAIQSEIDIINSRYLASKVIDKLNLLNDAEFNDDINEESDKKKEIEYIRSRAINIFLSKLNVSRKPRSYTITIQFESYDAKKAALIANTIMDEYLINQLAIKFNATKRANEWLNSKLEQLQKQVQQSELTVQVFREENNLIETKGLTISDQQLSELNTQLILARASRSQAEARLKSAQDSIGSSSEVLNSNLIQNLRGQEVEVLRKQSDLSSRYGKRHPKMINVNNELRDLRDKIKLEINKIKEGLQKEVEIAKNREESLEKSLNNLQAKVGVSGKARAQLAELIRQRDVNRSLYESFLSRSKETFQNQDLEQSDARIISIAETPLYPSSPRKKIMLAIAIILGGGCGVVVAFLREYLDSSFKNSDQLENYTNIANIGVVPKLDKDTNYIKYILEKPTSFFVESLRSILTAIHFSNPDNIPKSILVTSAVPDEGKTTFAISMAMMAANSNKKVLLIDCDLRKSSAIKTIASSAKANAKTYNLTDYLAQDVQQNQIINISKDNKNLHFILSDSNNHNSQDILASNKMKNFIAEVSQKYDLVILDSPPLMAVSDSVALAKIVDSTVFMVNWNNTAKEAVKSALKKLDYDDIKIAGTVLNNIDLNKIKKYSDSANGYYYKSYKEYYS